MAKETLPTDAMSSRSFEEDRASRQVSTYSLVSAAVVGALVVLLWFYLRPEAVVSAAQRDVGDVVVGWRCEAGHDFERRGGAQPIDCRVKGCDEKANMVVSYLCPRHGLCEAEIRMATSGVGKQRVATISFAQRVWQRVDEAPKCPDCGAILSPRVVNPFLVSPDDSADDS